MSDLWYPGAVKEELPDAGAFTGGLPKGVLHTTEGSTYPGTSLYHGTQAHFTCDITRRKTYQHIAVNRSAMGLIHSGDPETNRWNCIQIEIVGFTFSSPGGKSPALEVRNWDDGDIAYLAQLMRWIEGHAMVPRQAGVSFDHPVRMSGAEWKSYKGWCGHVHVPENFHVDGTGMPIKKMLGAGGNAQPVQRSWPTIRRGATGEPVHHLQACLNALGYKLTVDSVFGPGTEKAVKAFQTKHHLTSDGVVGPQTWAAISKAMKAR